MDASNIRFDPSKFKTRLEEKPFKDALQAQNDDVASARPVRGPKQLETEFQLPANTFLAYKKYALEPMQELPETIKKKRPESEVHSSRMPDNPPLMLPSQPSLPPVLETPFTDEELHFSNSDEFLCSALYAAAQEALDIKNRNHPKKTLWKSCCDVVKQGDYPHKARAIFKCACNIIQNPKYYPSQLKGGTKSAANDPMFIEYLVKRIEAGDTTGMDCLWGPRLKEFFETCHQTFYHANPFLPPSQLSNRCIKKLRKTIRLVSNSLNFVSVRRLVAMGDPRNFVSFYCAAKLTFDGIPLELRFNWDEMSILVCADARSGTNKCLGLAWTTEDLMKVMKKYNRSPGAQSPTLDFTPRMVQWGHLAAACGRIHLLIFKIYDRAILPQNRLKWVKIPQALNNSCEIIVMFIRGKQLGAGADASAEQKQMDQIDHGGLDLSHPSEKEVAEATLTLVAHKIKEVKLNHYKNLRKYNESGFESGSFETNSSSKPHLFSISKSSCPQASGAADGNSDDDEEEDVAKDADNDQETETAHENDNDDADDEIEMETKDCCPQLKNNILSKLHRHELQKKQDSNLQYNCGICLRQGLGPVYSCTECRFFAHPSCCLESDESNGAVRSTVHVVREIAALVGHDDVNERAALSLDGAVGQSTALEGTTERPGIIEREFLTIGCDVLKGSAQCSLSQNPLDLMRSFMSIKKENPKWTVKSGRPSGFMQLFIDNEFTTIMKNVSASDKRTFILALSNVERSISKHFHMDAVQSGWEKAGLIDLNFHAIMGHFLEYRNMTRENIEGVQSLLPSFLHEMATKHELSDQTMAMMQRFFLIDFKVYPTGRETLTISRKRATIFSRWLQLKRQQALDFAAENALMVVAVDGVEPRPRDPRKDMKGKAVCPCAFGEFHGRHYEDTDEGWELHTKTPSHKKWRQSQFEQSEDERSRQLVTPAHALPWFQQDNCVNLRFVMEQLNLSATLGKNFVKRKVTDADIAMLLFMTEDRWLEDFSMQPGQVQMFQEYLRRGCTASSEAVTSEMENQLNWLKFYDTPFEDQHEYEDAHLFARDQLQARHCMSQLIIPCRNAYKSNRDFAFGPRDQNLAIRGDDEVNAKSGGDAAEDEDQKKKRARRLRMDRANGRR